MENFGNKYLVKSNNIIKVIHRLHYLSYRSDSNSRLVWTWGKAALKFIEGSVWINYHYGRLIWFFNIDSAVLSPDMFPSDLFPQLVNFAEQLFLVPGQGFGYVYFAFGSDTRRRSGINTDRFPKRGPKAQALSKGVWGQASQEMF